MHIAQNFTDRGAWGVALFVLGNIVLAFCFAQIFDKAADEISSLTYLMMSGAGLANLISVPLMLIGREYRVTIVHIPKDRIS